MTTEVIITVFFVLGLTLTITPLFDKLKIDRTYGLSRQAKLQRRSPVPTQALWLIAILTIGTALLFPATSQAQTNFVYVNNQTVTNSVSGFSVSATGVLTPVTGSPFSTNGTGSNVLCGGLDRIVVSPANSLLFVTNSGDQSVSAFTLDPLTGILTSAPGSPFAAGLTNDSCAGMSIAVTPNGKFLMASSNGQIKTFSVAANGALSLVTTTAIGTSPTVSMKISPDGRFLAVQNQISVSVYTLDALTGALASVTGSPFPLTGTALGSGLEFTCGGDRLYGAENSPTTGFTDVWTVAANGVLTPIVGSPFISTGTNTDSLVLSPDQTELFQSSATSNSITSFNVNADGTITNAGTLAGAGVMHAPVGLAMVNDGSLLYAADNTFGIAVLTNTLPGTLAGLTNLAILSPGQIQGVAAYPGRSCSRTDLSISVSGPLSVTAGVGPVNYVLTVRNNGDLTTASPSSFTVIDNLPTGLSVTSCTSSVGACDNGKNPKRIITFSNLAAFQSATITISASTVDPNLLNGDLLSNTAYIVNAITADPNPRNNSATSTAGIVATIAPSTISVAPSSGPYFGSTTLSATLKRVTPNNAVAGRTLSFKVNGVVIGDAVTDALGVATIPASLAGNPAGTYTGGISVSFAGDAAFAPSTGAGNLTVNKAVLTVTAQNATKFYADPDPVFGYVITGFVNNDTTAVVSGAPSCTSNGGIVVGSFTITCTTGTLAATNYSFSFVKATMSTLPAPLLLTGTSVSRVYGDVNPTITGTSSGLKNNDQIISIAWAVTAGLNSPVGSYPIIPTVTGGPSFKATNYNLIITGALTVTPAPLTVTSNPATRLYGEANPALSGTVAGSRNGDVITAVFSSPATLTSPIGSYPITAALTGPTGGNYTVTNAGGSLTVTQAPLSIAANAASRPYGDPNPQFSATFTGIKNGDNVTATFATTAGATSGVGPYPIIPTAAGLPAVLANYAITTTNGALSIGQAALTVNGVSTSRAYGASDPPLTGSIGGLRNGDNITATYATSAVATSAVGPYPIVPTVQGLPSVLANYALTVSNGTLTISPAALTVSGANASRAYGAADPIFSGTITGVANGDNITANYATSATKTSGVGSYLIVPTVVSLPAVLLNYTVTVTNGTLTIGQAALTIKAADASRAYGTANPVFTGTITGLLSGDNITASYATTAGTTSGVGTYAIVPTAVGQPGVLANYLVTAANATLTIVQAALTVTGTDASRAYGIANPAFTGTITGLLSGDNITATYASAAALTSPIGPYPIIPTLLDPAGKLGNYAVTSNNGTLTVAPAAITVTGANASRAYGSANPAFTGTISGVKNGDNITASFASATDATSAAGTYPIVPTLVDPAGALSNYTFTLVNGTLTVTKVPLTITAANATRLFGDPNPAFTGTIAGLKNTDAITATYTSATTLTSPVGPYPIVPTPVDDPTGKLVNYTVTLVNGTLTIQSKPVTVSVIPSSGIGGAASQLFKLTYTDPAGFAAITQTQTIFNAVQTYGTSCAFLYTAAGGTLQMKDDSGLNWSLPATLGVPGVLANSQCSVDVGASSALGTGNNLTLSLSVTFKPVYVGIKNTYMLATNKFGQNSGWSVLGTWTLPGVPSVVSVTPGSGTGTTQLFQVKYSDPTGFASITLAQAIFSSAQTYGHSCAFLYTASTGSIQMKDDSGLNWSTPAKLGIAGLLENSQCSIDVGASSAVGAGNNLTLNYALTFKPAYAGAKSVFMLANNKFNLNSTWLVRGSWTVPSNPPTAVSVTPTVGTGLSQLFQLSYSDPAGFGAIVYTQTILSSARTYGHSCAFLYTASTGSIQMKDDSGLNWGAAAKLGIAGLLENSQCSIDVGASTAVGTGTNLTLNYAVTFKPAYAGAKNTYTLANNKFGLNSTWQTLGTWTVPAGAPSILSVTPSTGTGLSQLFQFTYSDPAGFSAITTTQAILGSVRTYGHSCAVLYTASTGTIQIKDDAGLNWSTAAKLGVPGVLQNSQCSIDAGASSAVGSVNNLTLNIATTFQTTYVGTKNIYSLANNKFGLNSGWQTLGTWIP